MSETINTALPEEPQESLSLQIELEEAEIDLARESNQALLDLVETEPRFVSARILETFERASKIRAEEREFTETERIRLDGSVWATRALVFCYNGKTQNKARRAMEELLSQRIKNGSDTEHIHNAYNLFKSIARSAEAKLSSE